MKELIIIKLGGSVITDKTKSRGLFRKSVVKRLVREIKSARDQKNFQLIIIHGAGSYGHPIAKKYSLKDGLVSKEAVKGLVLCRAEMMKLKQLVHNGFTEGGLNADIVDTSSVIVTSNGKIVSFNLKKIQNLLKNNIAPILSGDIVPDKDMGISIVSGDSIAPYLAKKLGAKLTVFVSDVAGVYDKNPHINKEAKLIKEISAQNFKDIISSFGSSKRTDVTGEMENKVMEILKYKNLRSRVISGITQGSVNKALLGGQEGTLIKS